jgi:protein-ribulosamine 3-kinase
MNWQTISERIASASGQTFEVVAARSLSGGDINSAFRLHGSECDYFVKLNRPDLVSMFEAEFAGLQDMARTQTVRVPVPVVCGQTAGHSFIVLEYLEFGRSNQAIAKDQSLLFACM